MNICFWQCNPKIEVGLHKSSPASESSLDEGPLLSEVALGAVQEEYRGKSELPKNGSPLFTNGNYVQEEPEYLWMLLDISKTSEWHLQSTQTPFKLQS